MRNDKHLATKLRKQGKSYSKISSELGISKSTLADWFSKSKWSIIIRKELTRKANYISKKRLLFFTKKRREEWGKLRENFREEASREFSLLTKNPLFIAGINIYWGEGDSKLSNGLLRVSNVDHRMIGIFIRFAREVLKIPEDKFRIGLILYPDLNEKKCKTFWQKITAVQLDQFHKTQFIKGKHPTKKIEKGICMVSVSSIRYKEKVIKWIDLFADKYSIFKI